MIEFKVQSLGITARLKIRTLQLATAAVLSLAAMAIVGLFVTLSIRNDHINKAIIQGVAALNDTQRIYTLVQGAETGQRGFLLTGQERFLVSYQTAGAQLPQALEQLSRPGASTPRAREDIRHLADAVGRKMAELDETVSLKRVGRLADATQIVASGAGVVIMADVEKTARNIEADQQNTLVALHTAQGTALRNTWVAEGAVFSILIAFLSFSAFTTFAGLRARDRSMKELAEAKFEADEANRAKSDFLASMSHELRTPLNAIIGFSDLMKGQIFGQIGSPRYREYVEHIHSSGHLLLDLINDILDLSKIQAGKMQLHEEEVSIPKLFSECLMLVKTQAEHVELSEEIEAGLTLIWADPRLLKQVLTNLLTNAIKFTPRGGRVALTAGYCEGGIQISVLDTGVGMTAAEVETALSEYGQVDSQVARDQQGTGLGLPICKSLVELHEGILQIESTPGLGTSVRLHFPSRQIMPAKVEPKLAS